MPQFAAALSEHPLATQATGEIIGQVLDELGRAPDLAIIFVTSPFGGAIEDIARTVRSLLNPRVLLGAVVVSVIAGDREVEDTPAVSLWAARFELDLEPVRLEAFRPGGDEILVAGGGVIGRDSGTLIVLADPFSFPTPEILEHLGDAAPGVKIIGGLASAGRGPGGNTLVLDDERFTDGAVGVWLPPEVTVTPVVSQGCRPIGDPLTVTRAERNVIYGLAGQPALDRLMGIIEKLSDEDKTVASNGLQVGVILDEHTIDRPGREFLIRGVVGADRAAGGVAVSDDVAVGATIQFHVRDAAAAHEQLVRLLHGRHPAAALVFTASERGSDFFGHPNHDASEVSGAIGGRPVAGMFCSGEIGPIGGKNRLHSQTASIALFG